MTSFWKVGILAAGPRAARSRRTPDAARPVPCPAEMVRAIPGDYRGELGKRRSDVIPACAQADISRGSEA
jgi:hypothetical protein